MMVRCIAVLLCVVGLVSCAGESGPEHVKLVGRAVLPADTFVPGPQVGVALPREINGRSLPFPELPVQGFSSLIPLGENKYLALQDNGFGTRENSPDYPLNWFLIKIEFGKLSSDESHVNILQTTPLSDPDGFFPYTMEKPLMGRIFTGADLDPESFVKVADGSIWVGDEFGPWLLHFNAGGELLSAPISLPTPEAQLAITGGGKILVSPDHPDVLAGKITAATLVRSGGLEGMALSHDGKALLVAVEKGIVSDDIPTRRLIMEFDLATEQFTKKARYYQADGADISLAALETWVDGELLVTERDGGQGETARIKRVYRLHLEEFSEDGFVIKELVCDLMNIQDEDGYTQKETGAHGLGKHFTFPFVTPEVLVAIDEKIILVANDNNYPMSSGRRNKGIPDNTEFILLELP
jgi:glycerophosphoryl diester phosphodiesterase